MLARLLRLLLLFELCAHFFLGLWRVRMGAATPFAALSLAILLALGWRAAAIGLTYLLALLNRPASPRTARPASVRQLLEGLQEVGAFSLLLVIEALDPLFIRPGPQSRPAAGQLPLMLIHGYGCNRSFWWWLKPRLEAHGYCVGTLTLEPLHGSIDGYAEQVAQAVNALCRASGAEQVILIGHSMGGLVARAYLRRYGEMRVAKLITVGTPHRGSVLACLGPGRNAREMEPGSVWLRAMRDTPLQVPCCAIYSIQDNFVMPAASASLADAKNIPLTGVGHLAMSVSPAVLAALLAAAGE